MTPQGKSLLTTLGMLLAAGGAGLYAYYGVKKPEEAQKAQEAIDQSLFKATATAGRTTEDAGTEVEAVFTELSVQAKGETSQLKKQGEHWQLLEPLEDKADAFAVEAILGQLRTGKIKREVEATPSQEELTRFGLKPPLFTVTAKAYIPDATGGGAEDPARTRTVTLFGGVENSFDGSVYLQREGDPKVYAAEGAVRQTLEKSPFDLRDKEVAAFDDRALRQLTVKVGSQSYALERQSGVENGWRLIRPSTEPADSSTVAGILSSFKGQRALAFPGSTPALEKALAKPTAEVTLNLTEGEPLRFRFAKLKVDGVEKGFLLRQQGDQKRLAEIAPDVAKPFDRDPQEFRDRAVVGIKSAQVHRLAFKPEGSDPAVIVERVAPGVDGGSAEEWAVIAPTHHSAVKDKISSALWLLESLKASAIVEEKAKEPAKYGFGPAARAVNLYGAEGKLLARIELGKEVPNRTHLRYVRGARGQVLEVEASKLDVLPGTLADVTKPAAADAGTGANPN